MNSEVPHSIEAERSVLGAVLLDERALLKCGGLSSGDFHREQHGTIFAAMVALSGRNVGIDAVTLGDELRASGIPDLAAVQAYLITLETSVPTPANVEHYAAIVADRAMRRRLLALAVKVARDAAGDDAETADVIGALQSGVMGLATAKRAATVAARGLMAEAAADLERLHDLAGALPGLATGISDLDNMTGGLQRGDLVILAARPSVGKTSLAVQVAAKAALEQRPAVVFSLEMPRVHVANRIIASIGGVSLQRLRRAKLRDHEWDRVGSVRGPLAGARLWVNDDSSPGVFDLRVECRKVQAEAREPLALVVVDYLGLMRAPGDNREQAVSAVSRGLKALAKEFQCPVLALSQLSRKVESREDKRPHLSDLRDSGSLESDADLVIFLHRADYYGRTEASGKAEVIVAKQRNGATGVIEVAWDAETTRFSDAAPAAAGGSLFEEREPDDWPSGRELPRG